MKVSLNSIRGLNKRYHCADDFALSNEALIEKIGAQLGAIDEVIKLGEKYRGIIIAKVVACEKHPDADKLSLCKLDDGGVVKDVERGQDGYVQVVCGAPNVRAGMLAAWLPPGTTVPETVGAGQEPLVLEAREIRGHQSNGMLASPKELGLGDSHAGLLDIDGEHAPGTDFAEAFELAGDLVLDIENKMFTHRPDCFGFLGIARELAGIQQMPFKSPGWYAVDPAFPEIEAEPLELAVTNEIPGLVPRFMTITMSGVKVGPSPVWLRVELAKVGQKSINNIVDYTNFFMLETAQPLHVYDYDKVKALGGGDGASIVVRNPKPGEKIKLLNGKEVEPRPEAIVIANDRQPIGLGGVMGGSETEVDENTKNIILEAANFDMSSIRRTAMGHGLFTDAVTRFTKGQSPLQNPAALTRIVAEIRQDAGGKVAGQVIDNSHLSQAVLARNSAYPAVKISTEFINSRLGLQLSAEDMKRLLANVEFGVETHDGELTITSPFWRTDIELREDVVEEVGRLYGYDKLPLTLPKRGLTPAAKDPLLELKAAIRSKLSKAGANEVLTYSFVHGDLLAKTGQDQAQAFQVANALSPDLQYYRLSLMPSLLDKVHPNIKAGYDQFGLFELGKTHSLDQLTDEGLPIEFEFTALVVTANNKARPAGAPYYRARRFLESLVNADLVYKPLSEAMKQYPVVQPYDPNRTALVSIKDGDFLGIIGEFKPSVAQALKLPKYTAGFEIDTTVLGPVMAAGAGYTPLSRFPSVKQDITLKIAATTPYEELYGFIKNELDTSAPDTTRVQLDPLDIYQNPDDTAHKQFTFRATVTAADRTLTDTEVNELLDSVAAAAKTKLDAERV
jgi:phenylalanyl-tRNA synthetase beta chain